MFLKSHEQKRFKKDPERFASGERSKGSRLEENRLHPDEGEVVVLRQALVADAAESVPGERRESVLSGGPVDRFCSELPRHEKVSDLCEEQRRSLRRRLYGARREGDGTLVS